MKNNRNFQIFLLETGIFKEKRRNTIGNGVFLERKLLSRKNRIFNYELSYESSTTQFV